MAEPQDNPLRNPPPPELPHRRPGRPGKAEARGAGATKLHETAGGAGAGAGDVPQAPRPQLPTDPVELDRVLAPHLVEFQAVTDLVNQLCTVLPPRLPLSQGERDSLNRAGARVLYVHGGRIDPGWSLALALLAIGASRFVLYKAGVSDVGDQVRKAAQAA